MGEVHFTERRADTPAMNTQRVSLRALLSSGKLGGLKAGMKKAEVEQVLGPPDDTGGTLSDGRPPAIYVYGDMQIFFRDDDRDTVVSVFFESLTGENEFRLPPGWIAGDWGLRPGQRVRDVRRYLHEMGITSFRAMNPTPGLTFRFVREPKGAEIVFDEKGGLDSIGVILSG